MKKILFFTFVLILFFGAFHYVEARSGCCSHHGGVCGCSCCDGSPLSATCAPYYPSCNRPIYTPVYTPKPLPTVINKPAMPSYFVGTPKTYAQLYNCKVVGNYSSMIYHLKGSSYIKAMNLKNKECFDTEAGAITKGFRKAKAY